MCMCVGSFIHGISFVCERVVVCVFRPYEKPDLSEHLCECVHFKEIENKL